MRFASVKEAREAVREVLGRDEITVVCIRYDEWEPGSEVVCFDDHGGYWMVKFYDDGEIAYGAMDWTTNMQWV